jgi:lipopolysaccharide biosynthesis glycosyltransferase
MSAVTSVTLCVVANETFAVGAEATLASAVAATSAPVHAYVVAIDLGAEAKCRLMEVGARVSWVRLDQAQQELLGSFYTEDRFSHWAAYARVLLGDFLPAIDRVIYLDTDTVVVGDLTELSAFDLAGCTLGAVNDPLVAGMYARKVLGPDPARPLKIPRYFNSGVMLIDLSRWRRGRVTERLIELLLERRPFAFYDQDPLNLLLRDDWTELPEPWNRLVPQPETVPAATSAVGRSGGMRRHLLLDDAKIVHFIGSRKPWMPTSTLEPTFSDLFWRYATIKRSGPQLGADPAISSQGS